MFHMSAFVGLGVPIWDIRDAQPGSDMLVRSGYLGDHLAKKLGGHPAVLMRGHGSTVVGENLQRAVGRTIYLEMNARMQFQAIVLAGERGHIVFMDDAEVQANVSWQNYERSWNLWKTRALAKLAHVFQRLGDVGDAGLATAQKELSLAGQRGVARRAVEQAGTGPTLHLRQIARDHCTRHVQQFSSATQTAAFGNGDEDL